MIKWKNLSVIENQHRDKSGRPRHARTSENIASVSNHVNDTDGRKYIRKIASCTEISYARYLEMLKTVFDDQLLMELSDHPFQQDGAPCHTSLTSMDWLKSNFPERLISRKSNVPKPANSPDLNPLD